MNILVIGGGLLGRSTAEQLDALGHDVSVVDEDIEHLDMLAPSFGGLTFVGFPLDIQCLCTAGIESCDAVAVTTSDDNLNITVGQIAKDYFHVEKVVARISDPLRETIFESFGLQTVCPTNMAGDKLVSGILYPKADQQMSFGTHTISFSHVSPGKRDFGRRIDEFEEAYDMEVFAVLKDDNTLFLEKAYRHRQIAQGDTLICCKKID